MNETERRSSSTRAKNRVLISLLALVAAFGPSALAEIRYSVTYLQGSTAIAINNSGQVLFERYVGYSPRSFLYSGGTTNDLGALGGLSTRVQGINDSGQLVGGYYGSDGYNHAFLFSGGSLTDLGTLGGPGSGAAGINNSSQIVGSADTDSEYWHAFIYSGGTMTDLGTLPGYRYSGARAINDRGQIVGLLTDTGGGLRAFFCSSNGPMVDMGTLGGTRTYVYDINNSGQAVGYSRTTNDSFNHAFLYSNGSMTDLGTLGGDLSEAHGINNHGQVVGVSSGGPVHAFLYSDGSMTDLNTLCDPGPWWRLVEANAINDYGQIVGLALSDYEGGKLFLLTPFRTLFTRRVGTNLAMYWFTNAPTPLSLFQSSSLTSPNWVAVTNMPVVINQQKRVVVSASPNGNCFYRLQSP